MNIKSNTENIIILIDNGDLKRKSSNSKRTFYISDIDCKGIGLIRFSHHKKCFIFKAYEDINITFAQLKDIASFGAELDRKRIKGIECSQKKKI